MKLTAIKAQTKNPNRVSVFVDGKYAFSLGQGQLLEARLHVGLEIDQARLAELKKLSDFGKLHDRILRYVLLRPHAEREVLDYCRRKQFDMPACRQIIETFTRLGYINDAAFAKLWVESRQLGKAMSKRALKLELKRKGISDELITQALSEKAYDEIDALRSLIAKKQRLTRFKNDPQKLLQYLARQGFGFDDIKEALRVGED
ncbi:MAG TPA: RecX family transcriptional regulator [Candidatus Acidoferrum sp.]|nr:RecX family transcriptional regulator [Candidatus Acidoferrum sp.]